MKTNIRKEIPLLIIMAMPFLYLAFIWGDLPAEVPMHWNIKGEVDRYGSKNELLVLIFLLPIIVYGVFTLIPLIDPKKKIGLMGGKYQSLKYLMVSFISALSIFILYSTLHPVQMNPNIIITGVGLLFMVLGNYFKTIRPNYFVGIRTPWTLENEHVWKDTHRMAGVMWFVGGLLMALLSLILGSKAAVIATLIIVFILVSVPIGYSYMRYRQLEGQLSK